MSHLKLNVLRTAKIVSDKTLEEAYIDVGQLVTSDEFNKEEHRGMPNYRDRAITALLKLETDFQANQNIIYEMAKKFIKIDCPHCGKPMIVHGGGGNMQIAIINYNCPDHYLQVTLSLPTDGINFAWRKKR